MRPEARDVETEVSFVPSDFHRYGGPLFAGQLATALQTLIGSLKTFDCQNRPVFYNYRLAYLQARNGFGHAKTKFDVGFLGSRRLRPDDGADARPVEGLTCRSLARSSSC